jgi:hypothetical protein
VIGLEGFTLCYNYDFGGCSPKWGRGTEAVK